MLVTRHPDHERHEKPLDVANDALERDSLDVEPVLRVERAEYEKNRAKVLESSKPTSGMRFGRLSLAVVGV